MTTRPTRNPGIEDMSLRYKPSSLQIAGGKALARAVHHSVYVPLICPGKQRGVWIIGQVVEHGPGFFIERENAITYAQLLLGTREGTVAYARIDADGYWSVFEE